MKNHQTKQSNEQMQSTTTTVNNKSTTTETKTSYSSGDAPCTGLGADSYKQPGASRGASSKTFEAKTWAEQSEAQSKMEGSGALVDTFGLSSDSSDSKVMTNIDEGVENFDEMNLSENLLRGIYAYGFEKPSVIQQKAIPPMTKGMDVIAQAQSGTGKTATFSVGLLSRIDPKKNATQALVLAPTRDLAQQTAACVEALGNHMGVRVQSLVGGRSVRDDIQALRRGVHVVSGTPGRVMHMIKEGHLRTRDLRVFCVDECDVLLDNGFIDQLHEIFRTLPEDVQVGLFSATMPQECLDITKKFMRKPAVILLKTDELTLQGIKQFYIDVGKEEFKVEVLCDLYEILTVAQCIIFTNRVRKAEFLADEMNRHDFTVSVIHGELEQKERELVLREFKSGASRVLIATDVVARGLDVHGVSLVINYDLPTNRENYIHRIGRSGRFGRKGVAINFLEPRDTRYLRDIEQFYDTQVEEMPADVSGFFD